MLKTTKNKFVTNLSYIEKILNSLKQIEYSFSVPREVKEHFRSVSTDSDHYYDLEKKKEAILFFFLNTFSFMKIVEKHTSILKNIRFNQLLTDITTIRDHFVHSYKKIYRSIFKIFVWLRRYTLFL